MSGSAAPASALERSTMRKAALRIVPFVIVCYIFAYLDRVNVGLAALRMNDDVGLGPEIFGLGSGIFFLGYFLFEVPSNPLLEKFGARLWIARIMITWGLISACMIFVTGAWSFVTVRFLLGLAEAGFYPGIILYITYFFPREYRARIIAGFTTGVPLSLFLGSPLSTALLQMDGFLGLSGWKWLFLMEALPSVLLGILCLVVLSDSPEKAGWLTAEEKAWLRERLAREHVAAQTHPPVLKTLLNPILLGAAFVYLGAAACGVGLAVWQPQIIKSFGLTDMQSGLMNSVPYGMAMLAMLIWGRMADRSTSRVMFTVIPLLIIAVALFSTGFVTTLAPTVLMLTFAVMATYAFKGPFWALVTETMPAGTAAVAIAHINAIGGLGSFLGSYAFGLIKGATGSYTLGLLPIVLLAAAGAVVVLYLGYSDNINTISSESTLQKRSIGVKYNHDLIKRETVSSVTVDNP
jgi:ACS family tartrate transporter-like MFS transporter